MTEIQQTDPFDETDRPGKTRTEWHPLLVAMLRFALDPAFRVEAEVSLGKPPLRLDILLVRREGGKIPEAALQDLAALVQQVQQFRDEEDFAMQQKLLETLEQFDEELVTRMLEELPAERRLRGLPLEERLAGLNDEDVARLRELLDRKKRQ